MAIFPPFSPEHFAPLISPGAVSPAVAAKAAAKAAKYGECPDHPFLASTSQNGKPFIPMLKGEQLTQGESQAELLGPLDPRIVSL